MKIRSQTELQDYLDGALAWRKRELTTIRFKIINEGRVHEKAVLLRAALPLLYAHWEGFIKNVAVAYLEYVSRQQLLLRELQHNFVALAVRGTILSASASRKGGTHKKVVDSILENLDRAVALNADSAIDTESNLSSLVLRDIMEVVGLEFSADWQKKATLIDHQLLKSRNEIAHGERTQVDLQAYEQLHNFVIDSLEQFKLGLENAAALKSYRKV